MRLISSWKRNTLSANYSPKWALLPALSCWMSELVATMMRCPSRRASEADPICGGNTGFLCGRSSAKSSKYLLPGTCSSKGRLGWMSTHLPPYHHIIASYPPIPSYGLPFSRCSYSSYTQLYFARLVASSSVCLYVSFCNLEYRRMRVIYSGRSLQRSNPGSGHLYPVRTNCARIAGPGGARVKFGSRPLEVPQLVDRNLNLEIRPVVK